MTHPERKVLSRGDEGTLRWPQFDLHLELLQPHAVSTADTLLDLKLPRLPSRFQRRARDRPTPLMQGGLQLNADSNA